jgi:serine protease Do
MKGINIKYLIACFILVLSLLLVTSCNFSCSFPSVETPPTSPPPTTSNITPIDPDWTPPTVESQATALPDIASVVALVKPSVVAINTEYVTYDIFNRPFEQQGAGSGWIIDEDGLIVTNNHVVEGAQSVTVTLADGRTFPAETIRTDRLSDLAMVKVEAKNLPSAKVGDSDMLRVGDWVVAIGNSLGLGISATKGIVSAKGVSLSVSAGQTLDDLVQTDAAINPGNSGGPLVNMAGEVIGINSVKIAQVGVEGMGYAISSNTASPIIQQLVQNGYVVRPWLGVVLYTVDQYAVLRYNLAVDKGALVTEMAAGSPADEAGIKPGDVITNFAGEEIATADDLIQAIHSSEIGQEVEITFWRGNTQNTTYATLEESPPS